MSLQIAPKCPGCGRLSVDNPQHCPEKTPSRWASHCQWKKCVGTVVDDAGRRSVCGRVYGGNR